MRIGIDARFYGSAGKGLGRYTQRLIEHLEAVDARNEYVVFLRRDNFDEYQPAQANFKKACADYPWYTFSEQFHMPRVLNRHALDLVHFPHFNVPVLYRGKFIVTIHDLILFHYPTPHASTRPPFFYKCKYFVYRRVLNHALSKSCKIITVSEFTKRDVLSHYPRILSDKVVITPEAAELNNSPGASSVLGEYGIIKPYFLYVGNAYPHKNLLRLLEAFARFHSSGAARAVLEKYGQRASLLLVGKKDFFYQRLREHVFDKKIPNVTFVGPVSDDELVSLYRGALAFVFPSLYEGFGLPPLEAMQMGVPVAASRASSLPEVLGQAAYYFNPHQESSIEEALAAVALNEGLRKKLSALGKQQAERYHWLDLAKETRSVYESV